MGCWVECTANAINTWGLGQVKFVQGGSATFYFPGMGSYVYTMKDVYYYGMRRAMADINGKKLVPGQLLETHDGRQGMVKALTDDKATVSFGYTGDTKIRQSDVMAQRMRVTLEVKSQR